MIVRLEMPLINPSLRGGSVVSWTKNVGDTINFGDEICIVALDEFAALRRTARATLLAGRKRKKLKSDLEVRSGKVFVEMAITSAEPGVLRKIVTAPGDQIAVGDTMALVGSSDQGDLGTEDEWASAPAMRVAANPIGGDQDFEEST